MRLFVAFDLPEAVRKALGELIRRLKQDCPTARWVRPEGIHITVKFIGHIEDKKLDEICAALAPFRSEQPVEMEFRGLGFFPNDRRPRVVWCGVKASANLAPLSADIERALEPLGIPRESRDFTPHLTLARLESAKDPRTQVGIWSTRRPSSQTKALDSARATEFHLFESVLKRSGAEYKRLQAFPFVKGSA